MIGVYLVDTSKDSPERGWSRNIVELV